MVALQLANKNQQQQVLQECQRKMENKIHFLLFSFNCSVNGKTREKKERNQRIQMEIVQSIENEFVKNLTVSF